MVVFFFCGVFVVAFLWWCFFCLCFCGGVVVFCGVVFCGGAFCGGVFCGGVFCGGVFVV